MEKEVIYESEIYRGRILAGWIATLVLIITFIFFEFWVLKVTAITPAFLTLLFTGALLTILGVPIFALLRYVLISRPNLIVYKNSLCIGAEYIPFTEIKSVVYGEQKNSIWFDPENEVIINLQNGDSFTVRASYYVNGAQLHKVCEEIEKANTKGIFEIAGLPQRDIISNSLQLADLSDESFRKYSLNPLFSFNLYLVLIILWGSVTVLEPNKNIQLYPRIAFSLFFLLMAALLGNMLKYFLVSDKYLVARNYLYFWQATIIPIKDIRNINLQNSGRAKLIYIMTNGYNVYKFRIALLSYTEVKEMIDSINNLRPKP